MKKVAMFMLSAALLMACKKEADMNQLRTRLTGAWEYEQFSGYPFANTYLPPGNGYVIVLNSDGIFERRKHDTLLFRGTYSLENRKDCSDRNSALFITTNDTGYTWDGYVDIVNNKLSFSSPNCVEDGGVTYYRKIQ